MGTFLGMTSHMEGFERAARSVCASVSNVQWNSHSTRQSVCVVVQEGVWHIVPRSGRFLLLLLTRFSHLEFRVSH